VNDAKLVDLDPNIRVAGMLDNPPSAVLAGVPSEIREAANDQVEDKAIPGHGLLLTAISTLSLGFVPPVPVLDPGAPEDGDLPVVRVVDEDVGGLERERY